MKKTKKSVIDPIKAKYIKKIGFFKKIQIKFNNLVGYLKTLHKSNSDIQEFEQMFFNIILYGIIGNFSVMLFGVPFNFLNILGIGCIAWIIESKLVDMIIRILSSISIVKIYR